MRKFLIQAALLALIILGCVVLARPVKAAETSIFSLERASIGVTSNYCFYGQAGDQPLPLYRKAWEFGAVAAYNIVAMPEGRAPLLSATFAYSYDVDNKWARSRVGLTLVLWKGSDR